MAGLSKHILGQRVQGTSQRADASEINLTQALWLSQRSTSCKRMSLPACRQPHLTSMPILIRQVMLSIWTSMRVLHSLHCQT